MELTTQCPAVMVHPVAAQEQEMREPMAPAVPAFPVLVMPAVLDGRQVTPPLAAVVAQAVQVATHQERLAVPVVQVLRTP